MLESESTEQIWKDNDVEINKILTFSSQFNTVVEKFFVTIRSPKTEVEEKQKKLIDVFKNYNGELKDALEKSKRITAKKDGEIKKLTGDIRELEIKLKEREENVTGTSTGIEKE